MHRALAVMRTDCGVEKRLAYELKDRKRQTENFWRRMFSAVAGWDGYWLSIRINLDQMCGLCSVWHGPTTVTISEGLQGERKQLKYPSFPLCLSHIISTETSNL